VENTVLNSIPILMIRLFLVFFQYLAVPPRDIKSENAVVILYEFFGMPVDVSKTVLGFESSTSISSGDLSPRMIDDG